MSDHRYNPAPFCAKCSGPCQMNEDELPTDVHVNLNAPEAQRMNIALERAIATKGRDFDIIEMRNLLAELRNGMIAAGHDPVTDYLPSL